MNVLMSKHSEQKPKIREVYVKCIVTDLKPSKSDAEVRSCLSKTPLCNPASAVKGKLLATAFVNL